MGDVHQGACLLNHCRVRTSFRSLHATGRMSQLTLFSPLYAPCQGYFTTRSSLAGVLLLIDASVPTMEKDKEYADWLIEHNVPFTIVFTKCDRNKPGMPSVRENQEELERQLMVSEWRRRARDFFFVCFYFHHTVLLQASRARLNTRKLFFPAG